MAMIPTITATTPSRISEVDDDLSTDAGRCVDVDVDMTGVPFVRLGVPFVWPGCVAACLAWVRGRCFRSLGVEGMVTGEAAPASIPGLAHTRKGAKTLTAGQPVTWTLPRMARTPAGVATAIPAAASTTVLTPQTRPGPDRDLQLRAASSLSCGR